MGNKIYVNPETTITFSSTGTVSFNPSSVATASGYISAQWDRGTGAKPGRYKWRARTKVSSSLTAGYIVGIYLSTSDGTTIDGNFSSTSGVFTDINKLNNLQPVGAIIADSTVSGEVQQASGIVYIYDRYVSLVWWNALGAALSSTAGDHLFTLTPIPDEIQ